MLAELVLPGVAALTALAPVEDEILELFEGEGAGYVVVQREQLQQVLARLPAGRQQAGPRAVCDAVAGVARCRSDPQRPGVAARQVTGWRPLSLGIAVGLGALGDAGAPGGAGGSGGPVVQREGKRIAPGPVPQLQHAEVCQVLAEPGEVPVVPEGQGAEQLAAGDGHPAPLPVVLRRQVPEEPVQVLQQDRLLQADGCRQAGGEK